MKHLGRRLWLSMVLVAAVGAVTAPSAAGNGFGVDIYTPCGSCSVKGTRSDIHAPSGGFNLPNNEFGIERVAAENDAGPYASLIQVGFSQRNGQGFSGCGTSSGNLKNWWEYILQSSGAENCNWLLGTAGETHNYKVQHVYQSPGNWKAFVDGAYKVDIDVGWDNADIVYAGAEIYNPSNGTSGTTITGGYGKDAGDIHWQETANAFGETTSWYDVTSASCLDTSGQWKVEPPPSPFMIYYVHTGGTSC